jgi:hypothetical protein
MCSELSAQHFEWAASAGNVDIRYSFSSVDNDNNIVVGGPGGVNWTHRGAPELYDGTGEATALQRSENMDVVASYSPDGALLWHLQIERRAIELKGIAHDARGRAVLLVKVSSIDYLYRLIDYHSDISEEDERINYRSIQGEGFYLVYLDKKGKLKRCKKVFNEEASIHEVSGFIAYPNGGFVVSGFANAGKFCDELPTVVAGAGGGDFLVLLDADAIPLWGEIVSYKRETCCTYTGDMCRMSAAPDGTIYLAGSFITGATFGNGSKTIMASGIRPAKNEYELNEAYIASYNPQGKLNWVRTAATRSWSHSVAGTSQGVVVAMKLGQTNRFLGEKIDTTSKRHWTLAMLDKSGNIRWQTTSSTDRAHEIRYDQDNNLYVLGTHREIGKWNDTTGIIGTDTLQGRFTIVFIAKFDRNGKFQWVKEAEIPVTTSNELLHFNMDGCGNMYVSGTLWFTFSAELNMFDKAFLKGSIYGPAPFISRFKNTISRKLAKPQHQNQSCILSPGPWKLRNYPNPFASNTTFEYSLSYADAVTLQLFDMNGKLLQTMIQGKQHAAGKYTYQFNAALPSGNYIVTLKGTETVVTCKVLVVK